MNVINRLYNLIPKGCAMKKLRYILEFKSKKHEKEFMKEIEYKGVKNDKYTANGNRYREVSWAGDVQYQFISADQEKKEIRQKTWQNISGNINVFSKMYKEDFGVYAEKVTVNSGYSFWSTEIEFDGSLQSAVNGDIMLQRLGKYFHSKELGEMSLLDISKEFIE